MELKVGDRVKSIARFQSGVLKGESGTIIDIWDNGASVWWDEYKSNRHTLEGRCPRGHGWHVDKAILERIVPEDFGEFQTSDLSIIL